MSRALVAGGGGDLGRALCRAFLARGYAVGAGARSPAKLADALAGLDVEVAALDATDATSVAAWRASAKDVDVLVYNVGRIDLGSLDEIDEQRFRDSFAHNALGAFLCAKAFVPAMAARGSGAMIFVGATSSVRASARGHAFSASKHALRGLAAPLVGEVVDAQRAFEHEVRAARVVAPRNERRAGFCTEQRGRFELATRGRGQVSKKRKVFCALHSASSDAIANTEPRSLGSARR